jgi:DNA-binding HxlR family transcriptional regulator
MQRTSFAGIHCSMARTLEIVGEWWTPLVLRDIALGLTRFDDIQRDLGVSRKLLSDRLKTLVEHGVLKRRPYQHNPVRHDYRLTEKGRELIPVLMALKAWGDRWTAGEDGPPLLVKHALCGEDTEPVVTCSCCGEPLSLSDLVPRPGPGARVAAGTGVLVERLESRAA